MGAKNKKRFWWIAAAAAVLIIIVIISKAGGEGAVSVETAHPQLGEIVQTASAYGRIRALKQVKISPDVSGEITDIYFDEGDTVRRGDLLLKIKQESYLLAISSREAALGSAAKAAETQQLEAGLRQAEYERIKRMYDSDAATLAELQQADFAARSAKSKAEECAFQLAAAEAALKVARSELEKTLVYSPMDGIVSSLKIKAGERVVGTATMAGTEMLTISDLEHMELVVEIGENDICSVKVGDRVIIKADASPADTLYGRVDKIAVSASGGGAAGSATDFIVRIGIDPQDRFRPLPGMSASAKIITGSKNDILTVPLQAVFVKDGHESVWTVDSERRVHAAEVRCGIQDFGRVEIEEGLTNDDIVVTGPFQTVNKTLSEGDKIKMSNGVR